MSAEPFDLSIVIACYNEEPHLEASVREIIATLADTRYRYELLFIDDCSKDNTREIIDQVIASIPSVPMRRIFHEKNVGRGGTVSEGILASCGRVRGFLDIDLEVHSRYIPSCVRAIQEGADIAVGSRIYKLSLSSVHRYVLSRGYVHLVRLLYGVSLSDTESGYKFFSDRICPLLLPHVEDKGWFWDTEVMLRAAKSGLRIAEIPCLFIRRKDKKSTVRVFRDTLDYMQKLIVFRPVASASWRFRAGELRQGGQSHVFEHDRTYWWYLGRLRIVDRVIRKRLPGTQRILDVGCGTGLVVEHFAKTYTTMGVDRSDEALRLAKSRAKGRLVMGYAQHLPFQKSTLDAVLLMDVLEHMQDDLSALKEVGALLQSGGAAVITVPAHRLLWGRIDEMGRHYRRYSKQELLTLIERSGLKPEWVTYYNTFLFPVGILHKILEWKTMGHRKESEFLPILPNPINRIFLWIFSLERFLITWLRLPIGMSLLAVARKEAKDGQESLPGEAPVSSEGS